MEKQFIVFMSIGIITILAANLSIAQTSNLKAALINGKKVYESNCLSCHMADGGGVPHLNPPLIQTSYVLGDKTKLITIVLKGMNDRIPIQEEYYSNNMAAHKELSNKEIADVLTYIRNSFDNKADAINEKEVKLVRSKIK